MTPIEAIESKKLSDTCIKKSIGTKLQNIEVQSTL